MRQDKAVIEEPGPLEKVQRQASGAIEDLLALGETLPRMDSHQSVSPVRPRVPARSASFAIFGRRAAIADFGIPVTR